MLTEAQELTNHFLEKKNIKATRKIYTIYISNFKALLDAGYSKIDIENTIDYLVEHPPRNGFVPGFIQYTIDETLTKVKVQQMNKRQEFFESCAEPIEPGDNKAKYNNNKTVIKGLDKF